MVEPISLGVGSLHDVWVLLSWTVAEKPPVENGVDVFGESFDQVEHLGQRCPAFEDDVRPQLWIGEDLLENPADPEVLLHDGGGHATLRRRLLEELAALPRVECGDPIHPVPPGRFGEWPHRPIL